MESTAKAQMVAIIQDLPDDTAYDEILRELAFHRMIERGLQDVDAGREIGADEMRKRVRAWRRGADRVRKGETMAAVKWAIEAQQALREIHDHISRNRPETAQRTIESILNKVESLAEVPTSGQRYPHHTAGVHVLTYGHFRIAYAVEEAGDVKILGVFHGLIFLPLK